MPIMITADNSNRTSAIINATILYFLQFWGYIGDRLFAIIVVRGGEIDDASRKI